MTTTRKSKPALPADIAEGRNGNGTYLVLRRTTRPHAEQLHDALTHAMAGAPVEAFSAEDAERLATEFGAAATARQEAGLSTTSEVFVSGGQKMARGEPAQVYLALVDNGAETSLFWCAEVGIAVEMAARWRAMAEFLEDAIPSAGETAGEFSLKRVAPGER